MEPQIKRWIMHLDMDAFFASVEQLDNPELRGKPVIIGASKRGVASTASYEARKFGVHSAMPLFKARLLCPQAIFIPARMTRYAEKSQEIMAILDKFSPLVEKASIDEAYLDLTGLELIFGSVENLALKIQNEILTQTGLSCSAGLAPIKFLAKIASDLKKPSGLTILHHADVQKFLKTLPINKIPGIGKQMLKQLKHLEINFVADAQKFSHQFWIEQFGKVGESLFQRAHGIDPREVVNSHKKKSESAENTFEFDTIDREILSKWLLTQSERIGMNLRNNGLFGHTITLKLKYADFTQHTRGRTLKQSTNTTKIIYETALALLDEKPLAQPLRLIGISISQFKNQERQLSLFPIDNETQPNRDVIIDSTIDQLRKKFGNKIIMRGKLYRLN